MVLLPVPILKLSPYNSGLILLAAKINASHASLIKMKSLEISGFTKGGNFFAFALFNIVGISLDESSSGP